MIKFNKSNFLKSNIKKYKDEKSVQKIGIILTIFLIIFICSKNTEMFIYKTKKLKFFSIENILNIHYNLMFFLVILIVFICWLIFRIYFFKKESNNELFYSKKFIFLNKPFYLDSISKILLLFYSIILYIIPGFNEQFETFCMLTEDDILSRYQDPFIEESIRQNNILKNSIKDYKKNWEIPVTQKIDLNQPFDLIYEKVHKIQKQHKISLKQIEKFESQYIVALENEYVSNRTNSCFQYNKKKYCKFLKKQHEILVTSQKNMRLIFENSEKKFNLKIYSKYSLKDNKVIIFIEDFEKLD